MLCHEYYSVELQRSAQFYSKVRFYYILPNYKFGQRCVIKYVTSTNVTIEKVVLRGYVSSAHVPAR